MPNFDLTLTEHDVNMNWLLPKLIRAWPEYDLFLSKEPEEITMADIVMGDGFEDELFRWCVCEINDASYGNYTDREGFIQQAYTYIRAAIEDLESLKCCVDLLDPTEA
jgi:hypothetical protein